MLTANEAMRLACQLNAEDVILKEQIARDVEAAARQGQRQIDLPVISDRLHLFLNSLGYRFGTSKSSPYGLQLEFY